MHFFSFWTPTSPLPSFCNRRGGIEITWIVYSQLTYEENWKTEAGLEFTTIAFHVHWCSYYTSCRQARIQEKMDLLKISRFPDFTQCLPDSSQRFLDLSLTKLFKVCKCVCCGSLNPRLSCPVHMRIKYRFVVISTWGNILNY